MTDLHVALIHPEIPWNVGNTGRSCLAFGARLHLVEPFGFVLDDRRVRRAGLDYWKDVDLKVWSTLAEFEGAVARFGEVIVLTPEAEEPLWDVDLRGPCVFLLGSETRGLPSAVRQNAAYAAATIPMVAEKTRSLNVSTVAGMALMEARRQRGFQSLTYVPTR
ncbi:MAG: tRNA (cytidine(34)-2'-O)-methyltransferase [Myxococcales bacterium]|nr:tRNA (cytidine(34)-2'-O)-methyltransferase [Myxococcales bacterium]